MAEKKLREKVEKQDRKTMADEVVIRVYTESLASRSRRVSEDPIKKTKAEAHPHLTRPGAAGTTQGYDRRAQLLAYSRQLRNEGSEKVQLPVINDQPRPRTRSKKRMWSTQPVRICSPSTQMSPRSSSRCRHERVALPPTESGETKWSKKKKGSGKNCCSRYLRKLKNLLKEISCKEIKW